MAIAFSKISGKGQITLPRRIRDAIGVKPGDTVAYDLKDQAVTLRRVEPLDLAFHAALERTLDEWTTSEDDEAFRDLSAMGRHRRAVPSCSRSTIG